MTPASALLAAAAALETQAAELRRQAAALDDRDGNGARGDGAPIDAPGAKKLIDTAVASKITPRLSSWLYSIARKHPYLGWKVAGSWVFSEPMLRAFMAGEDTSREKSEICEIREAPPVHGGANHPHISRTHAGTRT